MIRWNIRYLVFERELKEFLAHFPGSFPIKGMSLIPRLYKDPGLREVTDIDISCQHPPALVKSYLRDRGFVLHEDKWEANSYKINASQVIDGVEVPIEVHQKLLWTKEEPWAVQRLNGEISLRPEDELIYLCGHLAYQHTMLSLHWLIDIALLIETQVTWDERRIEELLKSLPLRTSLRTILWALEYHLELKLPDSLAVFVKTHRKDALIENFMSLEFLWKSQRMAVRYYALKHLLKDSIKEALTYDRLWLKQRLRGEKG